MNGRIEPIDVRPVLEDLGVLNKEDDGDVLVDKSVSENFLGAMQVQTNRQECVDRLFPNGIPVGLAFYAQLAELGHWIGVSESGDEAIGMVWSEVFSRLEQPQKQELLEEFAQQPLHDFFENSRSMWVVARDHPFPVDFLAEWFISLLKAVEGDGMQGDVWRTIRVVCATHCRVAVDVLREYLTCPDERRDNIAGYMLGALRLEILDNESAKDYGEIEQRYRESEGPSCRAVFNWSWVTTARERDITEEELKRLIVRSEKSVDDLNSTLFVICRLIEIERLPKGLLKQSVDWINKTIRQTLSSKAKYCVVNVANRLLRNSEGIHPAVHSKDWILAIQPVDDEDRGTWNRISQFLLHFLKKDSQDLTLMLIQLCSTSARTIHKLMVEGEMTQFLHELGNHDECGAIVTKLALSVDTATRRLGLFLLNKLDVKELSSSEMASSDENAIQLLFYEAQKTILNPKTVGRVLAAVASVVNKTNNEFHDELFEELKLQWGAIRNCRRSRWFSKLNRLWFPSEARPHYTWAFVP